MANNDELIYKGKALKDLRGIKDVLQSQGDPFLANIMHRAIECIENQPAAVPQELQKVVREFCAEYEKAKNNPVVYNPVGYALHKTWTKYE